MQYKLTIPGRLPGLNELIEAERANRYKGAQLKKDAERRICAEIRRQLHGIHIRRPVVMRYLWVEQDRRRDRDNITAGRKFVQDALVRCKVLQNDGWKEIAGFSDDWAVDKVRPRVEIEITEKEAVKMGLAALRAPTREQVEALRGEWIKRDGYTECSKCEYWYPSGEVEEEDDRTPFCPRCGRPMTDEAVEITLRRLEALHENDR